MLRAVYGLVFFNNSSPCEIDWHCLSFVFLLYIQITFLSHCKYLFFFFLIFGLWPLVRSTPYRKFTGWGLVRNRAASQARPRRRERSSTLGRLPFFSTPAPRCESTSPGRGLKEDSGCKRLSSRDGRRVQKRVWRGVPIARSSEVR